MRSKEVKRKRRKALKKQKRHQRRREAMPMTLMVKMEKKRANR